MKATVLMPVFNGEKHLNEAINSILSQSFQDFEFLIIDDGSTDHSKKIIRSYQDKRIRFIENDRNLQLSRTLNRGIQLAKGEYILRMDADDISFPNRLEKQIQFMDQNLEIIASGSSLKLMGESISWTKSKSTCRD